MGENIVSFPIALVKINEAIGEKFIIIDKWDCLFCEDKFDKKIKKNILNFYVAYLREHHHRSLYGIIQQKGELVRSRIKNMKVL